MERDVRAQREDRQTAAQRPRDQHGERHEGSAKLPYAGAAAAGRLVMDDASALSAADPKSLRALAHAIGNSAMAALLRGGAALSGAGELPQMAPEEGLVNRVKTSPPAMALHTDTPDTSPMPAMMVGDMARHMGAL